MNANMATIKTMYPTEKQQKYINDFNKAILSCLDVIMDVFNNVDTSEERCLISTETYLKLCLNTDVQILFGALNRVYYELHSSAIDIQKGVSVKRFPQFWNYFEEDYAFLSDCFILPTFEGLRLNILKSGDPAKKITRLTLVK